MDPASIVFAALLPIALMAVPISAIWTHHRRKVLELQAQSRTGTPAQIEDMEKRLRILERIVTDKGYDVARQIEALEDARPLATPQQHEEYV